MKLIDNRQKEQIQLKAQKGLRGFKNPFAFFAKKKETSHPPQEKSGKKEEAKQTQEASAEPVANYHAGPKVGRNDPCSCGSGKKYKKCCLDKKK